MKKELPKQYDPKQVENQIYEMWMENGCFKAEADPDKKPVFHRHAAPQRHRSAPHGPRAGLHAAGHPDALQAHAGLQRAVAPGHRPRRHRHRRSRSRKSCARRKGLTRYDLGREKFLERVWEWKEQVRQPHRRAAEEARLLLRLGRASASPWTRAAPRPCARCSCDLYDKGLIYKGSRIINWCPHCMTALSDAEVEYADKPGHLWHIRYPLSDGSGEHRSSPPPARRPCWAIPAWRSTRRTSAIKHLIGKTVHPAAGEPRDSDRGRRLLSRWTSAPACVKMTPAHDPNDFEVGLRHNLRGHPRHRRQRQA